MRHGYALTPFVLAIIAAFAVVMILACDTASKQAKQRRPDDSQFVVDSQNFHVKTHR